MSAPLSLASMAGQDGQFSDSAAYSAKKGYDDACDGSDCARQQTPEVVSYAPRRGSEGTRVYVQIKSPYNLHSSSCAALLFVFASKERECAQQFLGYQDSVFHYSLSADVPPFLSTRSASFSMPLQIAIVFQDDSNVVVLDVGVYTYEGVPQPSPSNESRKRSLSSISEPSDNSRPVKKASSQSLRTKSNQADGYTHQRSASYSPYMQPMPPAINSYATSFQPTSSPRASVVSYSGLSSTPSSTIHAPSPLTPSWSPSFGSLNANDARMCHGLQLSHNQLSQNAPSTSNPPLIRTSTIQQHAGAPSHVQTFNPYAVYPSKATLKLNGDLNSMARDWSQAELDSKRRLVQFTRMQNGSTIHADFRAVAPEDRAPNSICISCILWEGKNECFVTSVDTIYLLESLVGVRFTVEEKNRIRRNLEGFRPLTVSKTKHESEYFFKVIMGFPAPKPRNIEKDVKVFPWRILAHSLKKIIGKYVCRHSSRFLILDSPLLTLACFSLLAILPRRLHCHPQQSDSPTQSPLQPRIAAARLGVLNRHSPYRIRHHRTITALLSCIHLKWSSRQLSHLNLPNCAHC